MNPTFKASGVPPAAPRTEVRLVLTLTAVHLARVVPYDASSGKKVSHVSTSPSLASDVCPAQSSWGADVPPCPTGAGDDQGQNGEGIRGHHQQIGRHGDANRLEAKLQGLHPSKEIGSQGGAHRIPAAEVHHGQGNPATARRHIVDPYLRIRKR